MEALPIFKTDAAFCSACGALLPNLPESGAFVNCLACKYSASINTFAMRETSYTIIFNKREKSNLQQKSIEGKSAAGGYLFSMIEIYYTWLYKDVLVNETF